MLKRRTFSRDFLKVKVCGIPEYSWRRVKPQIKSIRLWDDIVVARFAKYSLNKVAKDSQALGRVMWQGNIPNSADFMAAHKMYTVFHVSGCFKFRVTFHKVFLVLLSILIWNGFPKKIYDHCWHQNMLNWILLETELNSIIHWLIKWDNLTFHANVCNLILLFFTVRINWQTRSQSSGMSRKIFGPIFFVMYSGAF